MRSAQELYKRNYVKRFRKNEDTIKLGDYIFLRTEKKGDNDSRNKFALISKVPYLFKETDDKWRTVVIKYAEKTVDNVSRSRFVLAPRR